METPSSILIILASVFSGVEKFSFPHHFFFLFSPRETSPFEALPSLFPTLSCPRSPLHFALLLFEHRENFRFTALTFSTTLPATFHHSLPKDPTCHVSPFLVPSDPARSVTGAVPHQLFSRSGRGEVKNGRVDLAVAKSVGNMVTIREKNYPYVCARACVRGGKNTPLSN